MTYTPREACEFPNDNPNLHCGAAWICLEPLAPARAVLRSSLLHRVQAEVLTPARPSKRGAATKLDTESSSESATASTDNVVARLIALVERLNPSAPQPEPVADRDLAQESRRMLTALSLCKPLRIVENVPAPPAHVYVIDTVPAPPAHVYEKLDLSSFVSIPTTTQADSESAQATTDDAVENDSEPMTLRGFELATALVRAQKQLNENTESSHDSEQIDSAKDLDSDSSEEQAALANDLETDNSQSQLAASDLETDNGEGQPGASEAALLGEEQVAHDSGVYALIESGPIPSREKLDLEFEWSKERGGHSQAQVGMQGLAESKRMHDQLDLEFEWVSDSAQTKITASVEPNNADVELIQNEEVEQGSEQVVQSIDTAIAVKPDQTDAEESVPSIVDIPDSDVIELNTQAVEEAVIVDIPDSDVIELNTQAIEETVAVNAIDSEASILVEGSVVTAADSEESALIESSVVTPAGSEELTLIEGSTSTAVDSQESSLVESSVSNAAEPPPTLTLREAPSENTAPSESQAPQTGFAGFVDALVQVALIRGATRAAAIIPNLLGSSQMDTALLNDTLIAGLVQAKLGSSHDGSFRIAESLSTTARAWRELLDGNSEDFSACDSTLDDWGTTLLLSLIGQASQTEIKRELRKRGVAAFGMRAAA